MILLIFEGQKEEPQIMTTIKTLFFGRGKEQLLCSYGTDTYTLWRDIKLYTEDGYDVDVFQIVKERMHSRGDYSLDVYDSYSIDSIYLFFDYDPQNKKLGLQRLNKAVSELIDTFNNPMDNGQLFISYPMAEAVYCEDSIPSDAFMTATVSLNDCHGFKDWIKNYNIAKSKNTIKCNACQLRDITSNADSFIALKQKWIELVKMNATKANYICNARKSVPTDVNMITQKSVFYHELFDFVEKNNEVSILSSFPMFLFEYFHGCGDF